MAKILIVDDEEMIRSLFTEIFAVTGHTVCLACDGVEALRKSYKEEFDLAVVDMVMPGLDGLQTITKLRQNRPCLKIIAISGGDKSFDGDTYLDLVRDKRAQRVFSKPFERKELLEAVEDLVEADESQ
jgi:CheY-like chemotaxis protein